MPTLFPARRIDQPRDLRVVRALEAVGAGRSTVQLPEMSASFRDDLRAQLVAVAPRLVAEGVTPGTETAPRRAGGSTRTVTAAPARASRPLRTRPMTMLVAGAAVVVLGLGGATWLARGALPGDPLYGLKRTAEGVDVSLSGSNLDQGHALLVDAQTRVEEVSALLNRPQSMSLGTGDNADGAISASTVTLIVSTLQSADTDTQKGVTKIGDDAITRGDHAGLDLVVAWAQGQRDRIDALVGAIPTGPAHDAAARSAAEIRLGLQRATELQKDYADKACRRSRDAFGPSACLAPSAPATPAKPSSAPSTGATPSHSGGAAGTPTAGATPSSAPASATSTATATSGRPASPGRSGGRTVVSPTPILSVGTCGVSVVGVSLGTCPPTH